MEQSIDQSIDQLVVNTIKTLAMDAVQKAKSGHPGAPMGLADVATVLWTRHLTVDPSNPDFIDRDRFVLSGGHGSMLLYSLLHLSGFDLTLEDIRQFRQLHSKTPGHPENTVTVGVETTTGPLGQGIANAVGMAMAERYLAAQFNREGHCLVDHYTYAICGDGDLQEGISYEACSFAGHQGLGKLVLLYDDNRITIDGSTDLSWSEDVDARFEAMGWHALSVDGHDREAIDAAIEEAKRISDQPTMIRCRTHIGAGSPNKQDKSAAHGAPLGDEEILLTKAAIGWTPTKSFHVPEDSYAAFAPMRARGSAKSKAWQASFTAYENEFPELAAQWSQVHSGDGLPENLESLLIGAIDGEMATRKASGASLAAIADALPNLWGGSADLAGSNLTAIANEPSCQRDEPAGRNLNFGIREHGMGGIMNGMALHGGLIPYGGTFLTFADYMRGSIRLAALMKQRVIYVFTHDSIFLGEDGPTHQAVEHAMALRLIPNLDVLRPADARETAAAWCVALRNVSGPTALLLTRQSLPPLDGSERALEGMRSGAYVLSCDGDPEMILMGTGSEVQLCVGAAEALRAAGRRVRVLSIPSMDRLLAMSADGRAELLLPSVTRRLAVEAGRSFGWRELVGDAGEIIGIDSFGESAPAGDLAMHFGFNTAHVSEVALGMF